MRIEMVADDGRVLMFEDAGPEKFSLSIYKPTSPHFILHDRKKEDTLLKGVMLQKADVKRLAKAS